MPQISDHILQSSNTEYQRLTNETLKMGEMAASQLEAALDVVERRDTNAAERLIMNDEAIDQLEAIISHDVMQLALRGPMARDLREILATIRIASDIERIGDYAANLAKRSTVLNAVTPVPQVASLRNLGRLVVEQFRMALDSYRTNDTELALKVRDNDKNIDAAYTSLFRDLLTYMMEDPRNITPCTHLQFMAKNLERAGDHATNIAENVWFREKSEHPLPPREKDDSANTTAAP
ncbi:phosphate signaling complex protein PhoU [Luteimonas sp. FXH3W]|uniref:Phosphate-specific transport system accessory protein PhoU n=1 Tax=Aquilutibacter rugosus TaxID=3115820 RepID=A0ABU7V1W2_9GAMM